MDSGGSSQSSSGGEEEYDDSAHGVAGADSLSSLFYPSSGNASFGLFSANQQPLPSTASFFDPVASYLDQLSRSPGSGNPNPAVNLDPLWSRDFTTTATSSNTESSSFQPPQPQPVRGSAASSASQGAGGRNPRKRTRASRRAPTTVLTTDTSNFRSMVQEFTGIPAPPFGSSAASLFPRTRLDLFGNRGGGASNNPLLIDHPASTPFPPYLLRPFAQKLPVSLPFAASSTPAVTTTTTTAAAGNYQPSTSDLGLLTNTSGNLFFPSLLHQSRKYPLTNPDPGSSKPVSGGSLELPTTTRSGDRLPTSTGLAEEFGGGGDQFRGLTPGSSTTAAANKPAGLGEDAVVAGSASGGGGGHSRQLRLGNAVPVDGNAAGAQPWVCSSSDGHGLA